MIMFGFLLCFAAIVNGADDKKMDDSETMSLKVSPPAKRSRPKPKGLGSMFNFDKKCESSPLERAEAKLKTNKRNEKGALMMRWGSCGMTDASFRDIITEMDVEVKECLQQQEIAIKSAQYETFGVYRVCRQEQLNDFKKLVLRDVDVGTLLHIGIEAVHEFVIEKQVINGKQFWCLQQGFLGGYDAFWWAGIDDISDKIRGNAESHKELMTDFRNTWGLGQNIYDKKEELCEMLCALLDRPTWEGLDVERYWNVLPFLPQPAYTPMRYVQLDGGAFRPMRFLIQEHPLGEASDKYRAGGFLTQAILRKDPDTLRDMEENSEKYIEQYLQEALKPKRKKRRKGRRGGKRRGPKKPVAQRLLIDSNLGVERRSPSSSDISPSPPNSRSCSPQPRAGRERERDEQKVNDAREN